MSGIDQISVVYTCCKGQEYWPLNTNGELEMEHSELGQVCEGDPYTYQDRMDALQRERDDARAELAAERDRVERLQAAYLEVEAEAVEWGAVEDCRNHPKKNIDDERISYCQEFRRDLQPGDLPDDEGEVTT